MIFLKACDGMFVRLDQVREARPAAARRMTLAMENGRELSVPDSEWQNARWAAEQHVVAAAPGTNLLYYVRGCDQPWIVRQPVLAWAVGPGGFPEAITSTGVFRSQEILPAIQNPDGSVEDELGLYASYDEWLADVVSDES